MNSDLSSTDVSGTQTSPMASASSPGMQISNAESHRNADSNKEQKETDMDSQTRGCLLHKPTRNATDLF